MILCIQGLVFNTELITNNSFDHFSVWPLLKLLLCLLILTLSPTLNFMTLWLMSFMTWFKFFRQSRKISMNRFINSRSIITIIVFIYLSFNKINLPSYPTATYLHYKSITLKHDYCLTISAWGFYKVLFLDQPIIYLVYV